MEGIKMTIHRLEELAKGINQSRWPVGEIEDDGFITVYPIRKSNGFGFNRVSTVFAVPVENPVLWFAWRPVKTITGRKVWLKKVNRVKMRYKLWSSDNLFWWEYHDA